MRSILPTLALVASSCASVLRDVEPESNLEFLETTPELLLTWGSGTELDPHLEHLQFLCNVRVGETAFEVSVDARSLDADDVSPESVAQRVTEIYVDSRPDADSIHIASIRPSQAGQIPPRYSPSPSSPSSNTFPVVSCRSLPPQPQVHPELESAHPQGSHYHLSQDLHGSTPHPCPHTSMHKRIGFGFINVLDLLSMLGVILLALVASGIAALLRKRHPYRNHHSHYDYDYEREYNHSHDGSRISGVEKGYKGHKSPLPQSISNPYGVDYSQFHHLPTSGLQNGFEEDEVMRYIHNKLR